MTLSKQIFVGLVSGVVLGLFFGEKLAFLNIGGRAFIQLLQITVLPYVAGSLIFGFGSLGSREARLVFTRGGALLLGLWAMTLGLVFLSPLALPSGKGGAFFSAAPRDAEHPIDWVNLYIPSNPFYALANNVVPAVVVFAVLAGVALMGMKDKQALLRPLAVFNEAMGRVGAMVTKATPFGIFAIAAHTAATMRLEEFERLQGFLLIYAGFACLLTFWLLPGLVAATTHVRHRSLLAGAQDALVTAFVTSNLFIVLPLLVEHSRELLARGETRDETEAELVDVLVPTSFNFPHSAKLLSVSFVPFVAWFAGLPLELSQYPALAGAGLLAVFGSINTAIPFLLDLVRIPADHFQLFVVSGVLNSRFGSMAAAMHTLVIAILGTCLITGRLQIQKQRLLRYAAVSVVLVAAFLSGTRLLLARALPDPATRAEVLAAIQPRGPLAPASALTELPPLPSPPPAPGRRLDFVRTSGRIRVGFDPDSIPWAFLNGDGAPVGFDAEMAHQLALALGVRLEHVAVPRDRFVDALASGQLDVVMSGVRVSARATELVAFSRPYAEESMAFLVADHRREEFADVEAVRARRVRIAILGRPEWLEALSRALPNAEVVPVRSPVDFVEGRVEADALFTSWERACAWSLLHPQLAPAAPQPRVGHFSLAYAAPRGEPDLLNLLDTFIDVQRASGRLESARTHWILGEATRVQRPRWSVARDVLGWWREP
jgi:Na+/H+-dicarboxylate symporter/ABC-type amino acid transport substrate-binding protein